MYKAVFVDMDGTLLQKDHTISEPTKAILRRLQDKGILTIPVSARPLHGMTHITRSVIDESMPLVSLNGSYIVKQGDVIRDLRIQLSDTVSVQAELQHEEAAVMYYSQMDWFTENESPLIQKEQKITPVPIQIQPFQVILSEWEQSNNGPNKIMVGGDPDIVSGIEKKLLGLHQGRLNIYKSQPRFLEVMDRAASKRTAIEFLMQEYGILQEECIAIGDNFNDREMIQFAGMGVAMGNAPDEIKAVADYVTDSNNADGVAKALEHFFS
jgi:Cof subfamily protein (haloacid dehalogenase superfamily)